MINVKEDSNSLYWVEVNGEVFAGPYLYRAEAEEKREDLENEFNEK